MNIIVCVKQVPDTAEAELKIGDGGSNIRIEGLVFDINESDNYAIEEAILIKERQGGSVTVVTFGPERAENVLRKCLAKGADRAILLKDEAFKGSDAYAVSKIIHSAIKNMSFDLVLTGAIASDDGYMAVGVMLAELLGIPHATLVKNIDLRNGAVRVNRELEGGLEEVVDLRLPALLTVQTGINEPRYVSIMGIRRVRDRPIEVLGLNELGLSKEEVGGLGSWIRIERMFVPPVEKEPIIFGGTLDEIASNIAETLKEKGII